MNWRYILKEAFIYGLMIALILIFYFSSNHQSDIEYIYGAF